MLNFIGNGSAFNTKLGNNSAYIKEGNSLFLIDCGSNIFDRLRLSGLLEGVKSIEVLITHFHSDHIGSLGDLIFYAHYILNANFLIYTPQSSELIEILDLMGIQEGLYFMNSLNIREYKTLDAFGISIVPVLTRHVGELACFGYILFISDDVIYYSGDSKIIPEKIMTMFNNGKIEAIYQDTCSQDYDGNVHLSLQRLQEYIEPSLRSRVYCMHLDEKFDRTLAEATGFNVVRNIFEEHYVHDGFIYSS